MLLLLAKACVCWTDSCCMCVYGLRDAVWLPSSTVA